MGGGRPFWLSSPPLSPPFCGSPKVPNSSLPLKSARKHFGLSPSSLPLMRATAVKIHFERAKKQRGDRRVACFPHFSPKVSRMRRRQLGFPASEGVKKMMKCTKSTFSLAFWIRCGGRLSLSKVVQRGRENKNTLGDLSLFF